jgi:hypothetical protein
MLTLMIKLTFRFMVWMGSGTENESLMAKSKHQPIRDKNLKGWCLIICSGGWKT